MKISGLLVCSVLFGAASFFMQPVFAENLAKDAATDVAKDSIKEAKFVGVWEGDYGTPIYTKLVFHKDDSLTYCDVSSCHYVNCMKMEYAGSLLNNFSYKDATGQYEFRRISAEEIEARFINATGDVSIAYYEPE